MSRDQELLNKHSASDRPLDIVKGLNKSQQKMSIFGRFSRKKKPKKSAMMYTPNGLRLSRTSLSSESGIRINQPSSNNNNGQKKAPGSGRASRSRSRGGRHAFAGCTGGQRSRSCTPERNTKISCTLPVDVMPDLLNLASQSPVISSECDVMRGDDTQVKSPSSQSSHLKNNYQTRLQVVKKESSKRDSDKKIIPKISDHDGYLTKNAFIGMETQSESIYSQEKPIEQDSAKTEDIHYSIFSLKRFSLLRKSSKKQKEGSKKETDTKNDINTNEYTKSPVKSSSEEQSSGGLFRKRSFSLGRKPSKQATPEPEYTNSPKPPSKTEVTKGSPPAIPVRRARSFNSGTYSRMRGRPLPPLPTDGNENSPQDTGTYQPRAHRQPDTSSTPMSMSSRPPQSGVTLVRTLRLDRVVKNKWISGLAVNKKNEYVIVDLKEAYVVDSNGCLRRTVGCKGSNRLNEPIDVAVMCNGNLVFSDHSDQDVKIFNSRGQFLRRVKDQSLTNIAGVTTNHKREIIIAGTDKKRLSVHSEDDEMLYTLPRSRDNRCMFEHPYTVATNPLTGDIIVGDDYKQLVTALSSDGERIIWRFCPSGGRDRHFFPSSICVDNDGYIFIADLYNEKVYMLDSSGKYLKTLLSRGNGLRGGPGAIAVDGLGHLLVADEERTLKVFKYGENGFALYRRISYGPGALSS